ncbi:SDR family oxidoreductase [Microbacterium invictum]|uniref:NAD(P)-dependent dehydrogenase (Short-subunit alcohol dehydrogenase family) n=1 Tax=Microbacterium invictum TaxID=515415 RepID=A0AA40SQ01_9MICO|nr:MULTISPECIES: SDR family oxidoreductase [Microbacterium]MBB4140287.1 NAD(P)-dependent dehydrogenase (short-subunit alcohol dehydrogenase family) [Microbacterium invictum]
MARTYVITGSASGIGAATAQILRDRGDRVIGIDLKDADIEADLSLPQGRADAAARAIELSGGTIDAVIASAGISAPIAKTISVNYFGVTELLTALSPALAASDSPRAVAVSSMASLQPNSPELVEAALAGDEDKALEIAHRLADQGPEVGYAIYPSSKRALARWVRRASISPEWAGAGIPLNAVAPGIVVTPMTADLLATPEGTKMVDAAVPMPLNGHQPPESIAHMLVWLTSPENTHVAGQVIYNDGGADATLRGDDIWSWND